MGANVSSQLVDNYSETVNKVITEVTNRIENVNKINLYASQEVELDLSHAKLNKCPVRISQHASSIASAFSDSNSTLSQQVVNELTNKIEKQIAQSLDQVNSGLNIGQANIANVKTKMTTYAKNIIENKVKNTIKNVVGSTTSMSQTVHLKGAFLDCTDSPIEIDQKVIIKSLASNISKAVVESIVDNKAANDIKEKIDQKVSQVNKGLDISFILILVILLAIAYKFFTNKTVLTVVCILIVVLIVFYIYKRTRPDSEKISMKK